MNRNCCNVVTPFLIFPLSRCYCLQPFLHSLFLPPPLHLSARPSQPRHLCASWAPRCPLAQPLYTDRCEQQECGGSIRGRPCPTPGSPCWCSVSRVQLELYWQGKWKKHEGHRNNMPLLLRLHEQHCGELKTLLHCQTWLNGLVKISF